MLTCYEGRTLRCCARNCNLRPRRREVSTGHGSAPVVCCSRSEFTAFRRPRLHRRVPRARTSFSGRACPAIPQVPERLDVPQATHGHVGNGAWLGACGGEVAHCATTRNGPRTGVPAARSARLSLSIPDLCDRGPQEVRGSLQSIRCQVKPGSQQHGRSDHDDVPGATDGIFQG